MIFNFVNEFTLFRNYLPLEILEKKLNPLHPRMHFTMFGWNWPRGSGEEDFLILSMYFCYFIIISHWKGRSPSFEQLESPAPKDALCQVCLKIGPVVLEKKMKNRKVLRQWRRRTTDIYLSEKLTQAFGSGELIKMVKTSIVVRTFKPSLSLTIKYVQINDNTSYEMWPIGMIHWWLNGCTHIKRISRGTTKMPVPMKKNTVCGPLSQEYT